MRKILLILFVMLTCCARALAVDYDTLDYSVLRDSTSMVYYCGSDSSPVASLPVWEDDFAVMGQEPEPEKPLFTLPENFRTKPNPRYDEDGEYFVRLPKDRTSRLYLLRGYRHITAYDSMRMFLPFVMQDASDFSITTFGIRAKYVKAVAPAKEHFHIDLYKHKIKEVYPWEIFFPIVLAIALILLAMFTQRGYISRLYLVVFYHNAFLNLVGEKNVNADKAGYLLFASYILNVGLLAIVFLYRYNYQFSADFFTAYLTISLGVLVFYFVKRYLSKWFSGLFGCGEVYSLYYKNTEYVTHLLAIVLMGANIVSFYAPSLEIHNIVFYVTVFACLVGEVMKIFRLFVIIFEKRFPIFYLFLYLCGVEFLPVCLAIKILSR